MPEIVETRSLEEVCLQGWILNRLECEANLGVCATVRVREFVVKVAVVVAGGVDAIPAQS